MDNKEFEKKLEQIKAFKEVPVSVDEKIQKAYEKIEENEKIEKEVRKQRSKCNFSRVLGVAASVVMCIFLAGNGVAYAKGEPNIYSWILEKIDIKKEYKENGEYTLDYSKRDENNNIIWNYNTDSTLEAQYDLVGTLEITNDRIYINENGTIVALNKENGNVIWKNEDCKESAGAIDSWYLDENQNLYIYRGALMVIDKNGKTKAKMSHEILSGDGIGFYPIDNNELLLSGMNGYVGIDIENFKVKYKITEQLEEENIILTKFDEQDKKIWETNIENIGYGFFEAIGDYAYFSLKEKIILINLKNGKIMWENQDYKYEEMSGRPKCMISDDNLYVLWKNENNNWHLSVIDKHGKTIKIINNFKSEITDFEELLQRVGNDIMVIAHTKDIERDIKCVINLKDYSITYENIKV